MKTDFTLMAVDVEGGTANPVVLAAVIAWGAVIAIPLFFVFWKVETGRQRLLATAAILAFGCLSSPFANRGIALLIYQVGLKAGVSVGFFGGPPFFLSSLLALTITGLGALLIGRKPAQLGV